MSDVDHGWTTQQAYKDEQLGEEMYTGLPQSPLLCLAVFLGVVVENPAPPDKISEHSDGAVCCFMGGPAIWRAAGLAGFEPRGLAFGGQLACRNG